MNSIHCNNFISVYKKHNFTSFDLFEKSTFLISTLGPLSLFSYFIFIAPYYLEYRSLENLAELHIFTAQYGAELYMLTYLLALSAFFTIVGFFLGAIHKNRIINISNLISFICIVVIWVPAMMMVIGD